MTSINEIYQKYITKLNNNDFIYKVKSAYYLLTEREKKLYEVGFKDGYQLAEKNITKTINGPQQNLKKIIGYQFGRPKRDEIDSLINRVCIMCEVNKNDLLSKNRTQDLVRARSIIHNILSEKYRMSLNNIGKIFNQDHTTVLHSINMKANKERYWSLDQTIWVEYARLIENANSN
jgi:hypothetical protein|tara:strand:- start:35 stop:562 length:528 start_codon:yes stop_codon:yes gene_type:complete